MLIEPANELSDAPTGGGALNNTSELEPSAEPNNEPAEPSAEHAASEFPCEKCGKSFGSRLGLVGHSRVHRSAPVEHAEPAAEPNPAGNEPVEPILILKAKAEVAKLKRVEAEETVKGIKASKEISNLTPTIEEKSPYREYVAEKLDIMRIHDLETLGGTKAPATVQAQDTYSKVALERLESRFDEQSVELKEVKAQLHSKELEVIKTEFSAKFDQLQASIKDRQSSGTVQAEMLTVIKDELVSIHRKTDKFADWWISQQPGVKDKVQPMISAPVEPAPLTPRSLMDERLRKIDEEVYGTSDSKNQGVFV